MRIRDPYTGIRLKVSRAKAQIDHLEREFRAYLATEPFQPAVNFDVPTRILTLSVSITNSPDPMWGVYVGENLHYLRSALDHLIWELVILETQRPPSLPSKNQFPIFRTEEQFKSSSWRRQVHGISKEAEALIEAEQPFRTGEDTQSPLFHLADLSNADKHRTLHLTGTMLREYNFEFPPVLEAMVHTPLVDKTNTRGPIQQDAVVWRGHLSGTLDYPFASRDVKGSLSTDIAFDAATPGVGGWLVVATVHNIAERAIRVINTIGATVFNLSL
jgi:hypothetical protein